MAMVRKVWAGKQAGSMTYVLSDATEDRLGDVIEPKGWRLDSFRSNPIALFNHNANAPIGTWQNIRIDGDRLLADLVPAPPGTTQLADDVRRLIEADILRATSVGFRAVESEPLDPKKPFGGTRFTVQDLLETSVVSVPANPAALQVAKSLHISDDTMTLAFGGQAEMRRRDGTRTGGQAVLKRQTKSGHPMTTPTISRQIQDVQSRLNAARDALTELTKDDDHDVEQADVFQAEIEAHEGRLRSLERTEKALAFRAAAEPPQPRQEPTALARRPFSVPAKEITPLDLLWRAANMQMKARIFHRPIEQVLAENYPDHEATAIVTRAAIAGATTTTAGWAAELVTLAQGDFLANLVPTSVFPKLSALGASLAFGPNAGAIKIPSRATTPSIGGSFVAEGAPIPVRRFGTTSITLNPHKVGGLAVFSREIAMYSNPAIESLIRENITLDTSINIDGLLLDNVAVSVTRPAGLTNGVTPLTASTAHSYTAILADLQALTNPFYAVNAGRVLCLLLNPAQAQQLLFAPGPTGVPFGWTQQFTARFNVIESTSVPAGQVYMIDAADFVSVSGAPEFEVSEEATLHMEDTTPLNIGTAGSPNTVAAPVQSMFQTSQIAIRMLANVTWAMRRAGMVQFMTGVNWGP
jgi:HK97 family phage prohead protease/HK97 family phage major capsid protein